MDIKKILKKSQEQLFGHSFYKLDEMEQFFGKHNLSKFSQEEIKILNKPVSIKEIDE